MKNSRVIIAALLGVCCSVASAGESFIAPELGRGEIEINPKYSFNNQKDSSENLGFGVIVGHEFDSNIVLEGNYYQSDSDSFLSVSNSYQLTQTRALVGYAFDLAEHFRIIPKIGISNWKLDSQEGALFNPGVEERLKFSGNETFAELGFEFPVNQLITISGAYRNINFDFGDAQSANVAVKFKF